MLIRTLAVWLLLMGLAILNGGVREELLTPWLGEHAGHVASTLVLSSVILLVAWFATPWIGPCSSRGAWQIGTAWLLLTLAFEFIAGHYLFGQAWERLLADYDVSRGRIWPVVLLACLLAPTVAYRGRRLDSPPSGLRDRTGGDKSGK